MAEKRKGKRAKSQRGPRRARAKSARPMKAAPRAETTQQTGAAPQGAHRPRNGDFLVVGLGASAGGLEAVRKLLAALPARTGFAFVLIQHLDPSHESMLVELLARDTAMKVVQATDGMPIERDCVYVIPPGLFLAVRDGALRLSKPQSRHSAHVPFDYFLHSLADQYGERAVCIVLSGTGSDGSAGLKAVSEGGGLVIAQDPKEAAFDGMPQSAIATHAVNLVLPVASMPSALTRYTQHPYVSAGHKAVPKADVADKSLTAIIDLLRARTSQDFVHFKKGTLYRRIQRRMALAGAKELGDYVKTLREDGRELDLLAKDLLIHVTSFFRDPAAYEALAKIVIPDLVRRRSDDQPIRVWVPGCSTGEEPYSLAMLFFEEFAAAKRSPRLRIFASDISADVIAYGRNGVYTESIRADVSAARLARFFTRENHGYRVNRDLRNSITFTVHGLLSDPPFSRLDFISCRNLLIYLQPEEQEKVLLLFHLALRQGGILFLGTAETVGKLTQRFDPIPNTLRAFRRIGGSEPHEWVAAPNVVERARSLWPRVTQQLEPKRPNLGDFAQRALLDAYAPATVVVNHKHQGLFYFGPIDRYLRVAAGAPSRYLPAMLRDGLTAKFQAAVRHASREHATATVHGARVKRNGDHVMVSISARPVQHEGEELLLVSFVDEPQQKTVRAIESPAEAPHVEQIEQELEITRRELANTIRDLEATNQELMAFNEEAVSLNEEFQSTNEELETSREELQSLNEELTSSNSELEDSLKQQRNTLNDLENILTSSVIATLFLDKELNIRFFTPAAASPFNLIATDIGRPLADLATRFTGIDLLADAHAVLTELTPIKREVINSGTWYLCGISPYRTKDNQIDGVVINLADISELKAGEENLRVAQAYAGALIDTIHEPLVILDKNLRILSASQSFYRFFGATPEDTLGRLLPDTDVHHLDTPALRAFIDRIKNTSLSAESGEITIDLPPLGQRALLVTAEKIQGRSVADMRLLVSLTDITDLKHAAHQLSAKQAAELANVAKSRFLAAASHDLRQPLQALKLLQGTLKQQITDKEALTLLARAERVVESMAGIVNALLDINQLEAGVIRAKLSDFPINEVFEALNIEFAESAEDKGLGWQVVRCGLYVRSDRRLLEEMVRNLLSNAIRYTDQGRILLGGRRHGDKLHIEVWDTGVGVSEDQIPRIFEEYYQIAASPERGGLGLGLTIVQRLGELLAHPIRARSRVGKGSVFSIEVPLALPTLGRRHEPKGSENVGRQRRVGTILVIEDEASVRESLELMFQQEGNRVTSAASGEAALALVSDKAVRPDLVISDYNLPGTMNGVQTAAALRAALGSQVPVIILTGDIRAATLHDIAENSCVGLNKPVGKQELLQVVQQLLATLQPVREEEAATPPAKWRVAVTGATIFVVDDNRDTRDAMRALLTNAGYQVKTYSSAEAFLNSGGPGEKGCLITDVRMPGLNGLEMLARLTAAGSELPAIVITGQGDIAMAVQAMRAGAVDFIEKPVVPEILLAAVDRALLQGASPAERSALHAAAAMRVAGLTKREREVLDLIVVGHANKEIAARLGINQRTVETHRAAVMKKIGARSLADLVRLEIAARGDMTAGVSKGHRA